MLFEDYLKRGLLKHQRINFNQIERQLMRAKKDLETAQLVLTQDPEWAATIVYHAMLRSGRAFLFSKGYLPTDGGQHRTVVELTGKLLGKDYIDLVEKFERMRRMRNQFFYEAPPFGTMTEAQNSMKTASQLIRIIERMIRDQNPQRHFKFY